MSTLVQGWRLPARAVRAAVGASAVFLAAHGIAHTLAFGVAWKLTDSEDIPYATTIFGDLDVGDVGTRVVGVLWLVGAAAVVAAAWHVWRRAPAAVAMVAGAMFFSTILCLTQPGRAKVGLGIDVVVLLDLGLGRAGGQRWRRAR
jgi:hypothetical protein